MSGESTPLFPLINDGKRCKNTIHPNGTTLIPDRSTTLMSMRSRKKNVWVIAPLSGCL